MGFLVSCMSDNPHRYPGIDVEAANGTMYAFWPKLDDAARVVLGERLGFTIDPALPEESVVAE